MAGKVVQRFIIRKSQAGLQSSSFQTYVTRSSREQKGNIPIRVQHEGYLPHFPVRQFLLERDTKSFESFASLLDVIYGDRNVAKSPSWVRISTGIAFEIGIRLRAMVMRQLEDAWKTSDQH